MRIGIDIECVRHETLTMEDCREGIKAPRNYKKEEAIEKYISEHAEEKFEKAALDALTGRVVVVAWYIDDSDDISLCSWSPRDGHDPQQVERDFLDNAFRIMEKQTVGKSPTLVVYNAEFDIGYLWRRARILDVPMPIWWPRPVEITAWSDRIIDPMREWAGRHGTISQARLCRGLGIDIPEDEIDGSKVGEAWEMGNHDLIREHCKADVRRLREITSRLVL